MPKKARPCAVFVKTDAVLNHVTSEQFRSNASAIVNAADRGIQTVIVDADDAAVTVVGLNGVRFLPDPSPDPLDELIIALTEHSDDN